MDRYAIDYTIAQYGTNNKKVNHQKIVFLNFTIIGELHGDFGLNHASGQKSTQQRERTTN